MILLPRPVEGPVRVPFLVNPSCRAEKCVHHACMRARACVRACVRVCVCVCVCVSQEAPCHRQVGWHMKAAL
jgi:hypothetical protein